MLQEEMWRKLPSWPIVDSLTTCREVSILRLVREVLSCLVGFEFTPLCSHRYLLDFVIIIRWSETATRYCQGSPAEALNFGVRRVSRITLRRHRTLSLTSSFLRATSALDAASESLVNKTISDITASHSLTTILIAHR